MLESSVARIRFSFVYRTMRMQQESADWICPNSIDWQQYDQMPRRVVVERVFSVRGRVLMTEEQNWRIAKADRQLRRQGYDPGTWLPLGITQKEFDEDNSEHRRAKKTKNDYVGIRW